MAPQHLRDKLLAPLDRTLGRTLETPLLSATCAASSGVWAPVDGKGMPWQNSQVDGGPERGQGTTDQGAQIFLWPARRWRGSHVSIGPGLTLLWYSQGLLAPAAPDLATARFSSSQSIQQ
jgi:hypothetical protein